MSRLLICRDFEQKTVLSYDVLNETDNIRYEIVEDAPVIEERENEIGKYVLDENGDLQVVYEEKPKSQLDLIQEQLKQILASTATISEDNLLNMDLLIGTDEKVDAINTKLDGVTGE